MARGSFGPWLEFKPIWDPTLGFGFSSPKGRKDFELESDLEPKPYFQKYLDFKLDSALLTLLLYLEQKWAVPP